MHATSPKAVLAATLICCLLGVGLITSPAAVTEPVRTGVRDAARPGQQVVSYCIDRILRFAKSLRHSARQRHLLEEREAQLQAWKQRYRQLQIENAALQTQLEQHKAQLAAPYTASSGAPLIIPELLEAAVLGEESAALWRSGKLLARGAIDGVEESALVLEDTRPLIDQGTDADIARDHPVYTGRCVVGRIAHVGRWTSTVTLVTDPNYRGLAQLARETSQGLVFGAEGILAGQGTDLCRLEYVSSTESVNVGDQVFTGNRDGILPQPMYFGEVVKAERMPDAPRWEIWVRPAIRDIEFQRVQVLRKKPNSVRLLAD